VEVWIDDDDDAKDDPDCTASCVPQQVQCGERAVDRPRGFTDAAMGKGGALRSREAGTVL
jgi:hypothetical protein